MAEEMLDLVNEKDEVIGRASRKEVNGKGLLYRCAGVYVFLNGKIVLEKRSERKKIRPGNWSMVEETVKSGETYEEAAVRGVKEELGLDAANLEFIGKKAIHDRDYNDNFMMHFFVCRTKGVVRPDSKEISETRLVSKKGLMDLLRGNEKTVPSLRESISLLP